ncbi:MAG: hypothetical protein CFH15_00017 [Alphaproteobacteria bacterium MarineAlpha5_Bin5]|nr:MAG: hypothetical protein CFH15_00017 [Alphaproteobacteria bacterium MarineAlpha5_Bin5]PPR52477.1 MAG: hypothetical protein CFH14_00323 [Alphaproteobacteria bacterium MarineAlpha5_Bin4]|tara:strand:- start:2402 stop:2779 length:378 start_codon:yes stop_codon:yes gene_type:complete
MNQDNIIKEEFERKAKLRRRAVNKLNSETKEISAGVIVEGNVEELAKIDINKKKSFKLERLYIKSNASLIGNFEVNNATIAGKFEGELTVKEALYLEHNAVVKGKIFYKSISNNGAKIIGVLKQI